ncbi:MAG TPA: hypothetical protein VLV76_23180 [Candidatus Acidoferrum sp.]|nr:hypothetical protein [Candidatus Acidoferrum sp.]
MFHDIIKTYADALTVATTLRMPPAARGAEASAAADESRRLPLSSRRIGRVIRWLGRTVDADLPAASPRALVRTPHP